MTTAVYVRVVLGPVEAFAWLGVSFLVGVLVGHRSPWRRNRR